MSVVQFRTPGTIPLVQHGDTEAEGIADEIEGHL